MHGDYVAIIAKPEKASMLNYLEKPEGFNFDDDKSAKYGQLFTVRIKQDPDHEDKLCVTELEGMPIGDDEMNETDSPDMETQEGEM